MSNQTYNRVKWLALVGIPAVVVFVQTVGETLPAGWAENVSMWLNALGVLIGSLLQVSSRYYHLQVKEDNNGTSRDTGSI